MRCLTLLAGLIFVSPALAQNYTHRIGLVDGNGRREYRYYDANGVRVTSTGIPIDAGRRTLDLMFDRLGITMNLLRQSYGLQARVAVWQAQAQMVNARTNSVNTFIRQANAAIGTDSREAYRAKLREAGLPENQDVSNYLFDSDGKPRPGRLQPLLDAASDQRKKLDRERADLNRSTEDLKAQLAELNRSAAGLTAIGNRIQRQQAAERVGSVRPPAQNKKSEEDLSWLRGELNRALHGGPSGNHR
jgi:prefoldin subunit 5